MRTIKFRAWDDANGRFKEFTISPDGEGSYSVPGENFVSLQQFTGLHDKNGKEIYEGDIVHENGTTYNWEIPGLPILFHLKGEHVFVPEVCEVIGNIYENPELLK